MMDKKLKIGLILLVVLCVVLVGSWWIFLNSQKLNNQQEEMGTPNLTYTISVCEESEPKNKIVEAYNNKISFDIDYVATNCDNNKLEMERDRNLIKLLLQGEICRWSIKCYNIKGEIAPLKNDRYILELHKAGSETFETFRKEVYLN